MLKIEIKKKPPTITWKYKKLNLVKEIETNEMEKEKKNPRYSNYDTNDMVEIYIALYITWKKVPKKQN